MESMDIWLHLDTIDQAKVDQLRVRAYEYAQDHPDEIDMEDVQNRIASPSEVQGGKYREHLAVQDWMLKRILITSKPPFNVDSALERFMEIFQFRKQWQVARLTMENTLPVEFFQVKPFLADGLDREGHRLLISRFKFYRKLPQFDLIIKRAIVHLIEQQDLYYEQRGNTIGVTLLMDCQDFNFLHSNMDMLNFIIGLGFKYPGNIRTILIYSLPWPLKVLIRMAEKLVDTFVGVKLVSFHSIDKHNIHQFIDPDQLPTFLHGTRPLNFQIPPTAVPLLEMVKGVSEIEERNALKIHEYVTKELL